MRPHDRYPLRLKRRRSRRQDRRRRLVTHWCDTMPRGFFDRCQNLNAILAPHSTVGFPYTLLDDGRQVAERAQNAACCTPLSSAPDLSHWVYRLFLRGEAPCAPHALGGVPVGPFYHEIDLAAYLLADTAFGEAHVASGTPGDLTPDE